MATTPVAVSGQQRMRDVRHQVLSVLLSSGGTTASPSPMQPSYDAVNPSRDAQWRYNSPSPYEWTPGQSLSHTKWQPPAPSGPVPNANLAFPSGPQMPSGSTGRYSHAQMHENEIHSFNTQPQCVVPPDSDLRVVELTAGLVAAGQVEKRQSETIRRLAERLQRLEQAAQTYGTASPVTPNSSRRPRTKRRPQGPLVAPTSGRRDLSRRQPRIRLFDEDDGDEDDSAHNGTTDGRDVRTNGVVRADRVDALEHENARLRADQASAAKAQEKLLSTLAEIQATMSTLVSEREQLFLEVQGLRSAGHENADHPHTKAVLATSARDQGSIGNAASLRHSQTSTAKRDIVSDHSAASMDNTSKATTTHAGRKQESDSRASLSPGSVHQVDFDPVHDSTTAPPDAPPTQLRVSSPAVWADPPTPPELDEPDNDNTENAPFIQKLQSELVSVLEENETLGGRLRESQKALRDTELDRELLGELNNEIIVFTDIANSIEFGVMQSRSTARPSVSSIFESISSRRQSLVDRTQEQMRTVAPNEVLHGMIQEIQKLQHSLTTRYGRWLLLQESKYVEDTNTELDPTLTLSSGNETAVTGDNFQSSAELISALEARSSTATLQQTSKLAPSSEKQCSDTDSASRLAPSGTRARTDDADASEALETHSASHLTLRHS